MIKLPNKNDIIKMLEETISKINNLPEDTPIKEVTSIIYKDSMDLSKSLFTLWFNTTIGTGYTRSKIFINLGSKDINKKCTMMKFNGLKSKQYLTRFGYVTLKRAYYCNNNSGCFPIEEKYPWLKDDFLPDVKEIACYTSMLEPYETASDILKKLANLSISASSLQKITKKTGDYFVNQEDKNSTDYTVNKYEKEEPTELLVVSTDGAHIHTRQGWKEVKTGAVYQVKRGVDQKLHANKKTYISRIESSEELGKRLWMEARRRNMHLAKQIVVIGDGAKWIWNIADRYFKNCIEIIDWYHATEHLWKITELLYGNKESFDGKVFEKECENRLYCGLIMLLEEKIREKVKDEGIKPSSTRFVQIETEIQYFIKNEKRMKYKDFENNNLPIGSGVIEGACKHLVQLRMKRNSMRWSVDGAHALLQLRCLYFSNRWNEVTSFFEKAG